MGKWNKLEAEFGTWGGVEDGVGVQAEGRLFICKRAELHVPGDDAPACVRMQREEVM